MTSILNNRYRLIKPLGEGGFGNTFLAEDTHMPSGRRCVIKQLKAVTDDPQYYQLVKDRFQREAATLEKLGQGHKQIPDLYAYFAEADQFYLVQEWIEGETLTKLLANGKSPQVKELLVSLLPVLAYIHSNRIVHRDIKPDNIIIRSGDNQPVLIDFGAVKEAMGTMVNSQGNATNSIVIGTPGFMPSEQAAGRPVYSSDLYSLGLVGIYCLTGKMPQELSHDPQTDQIFWQKYAPQVNPQLATVINKAIMSNSRDRFNSAEEMLKALQNNVNVDNAPTIAVAPGNRNPVSQEELDPTVAVAAPSPQTATVPAKKSGLAPSIILGSFIIGSLLGFSLMLGLMLSNTSNQTKQETASSTTESSQSDSSGQTSSTTKSSQPNSSGQASSTTKSTESNSSEQASSQNRPTKTENNSSTQEESTNQTNNPSQPLENNQSPVTVAEETPSDTQEKPQLSPQETVSTYYQNLNEGNLEAAWEKLPKELQNNPRVHPQGYISYAKWFNQVDSIDVQTIEVKEEKEDSAKVDVRFKYNMKNGKTSNHYLRYNLIWDKEKESWQFWQITGR